MKNTSNQLSLLCGLLFVFANVQAQQPAFKVSQSSIYFDINDEIYDEAVANKISDDKIYISFIMTKDCEIKEYQIYRQAKLKNFNLLAEKEKEKIISQLKKVFECNPEKNQIFQTPIAIHIEF